MDTKTLAAQLGVSQTTILSRAEKLNIQPTETSLGRGRPKKMWTEEQAQKIAQFGDTTNTAKQNASNAQSWATGQESTGALALGNVQGQLSASLQGSLGALNGQLDQVEDQMGMVIAARVQAVPSRAIAKAAAILEQSGMGMDFSQLGNISALPQTPTPYRMASLLDNFGPEPDEVA